MAVEVKPGLLQKNPEDTHSAQVRLQLQGWADPQGEQAQPAVCLGPMHLVHSSMRCKSKQNQDGVHFQS